MIYFRNPIGFLKLKWIPDIRNLLQLDQWSMKATEICSRLVAPLHTAYVENFDAKKPRQSLYWIQCKENNGWKGRCVKEYLVYISRREYKIRMFMS